MPLTDQVPPLTVVVAAEVVLLAVSVMVTEIVSPLLPASGPVTVTLPALAMLMFGVLVKERADCTVSTTVLEL